MAKAKGRGPNLETVRSMNAAMARAAAPDPVPGDTLHVGDPRLPAEPKRGRGRPKRGEDSKPINVVVGGQRHGVRLSTSERAAIEREARKEGVAVSALLRRVALVFALDEDVRRSVKGSSSWRR